MLGIAEICCLLRQEDNHQWFCRTFYRINSNISSSQMGEWRVYNTFMELQIIQASLPIKQELYFFLSNVIIFIHFYSVLSHVLKINCAHLIWYPLTKTKRNHKQLPTFFPPQVKMNFFFFFFYRAVVSPKSRFHLAYIFRVAEVTVGLMRFRESSKSFILMLRICKTPVENRNIQTCTLLHNSGLKNQDAVKQVKTLTSLADILRTWCGPNSV